ncbi:expressed unknown protein [Seminavis robusta]|uniref:Uncharacterized protein n=1 Tax=Seminavis robusta TaxID=568900 RepID=A0A9N8HTJ9_9STRA|nr:expressed unknown protein [Seminavis robusta]|eukprot:Sro1895_g304011.1  (113) ;mRNA; f:19945-20283
MLSCHDALGGEAPFFFSTPLGPLGTLLLRDDDGDFNLSQLERSPTMISIENFILLSIQRAVSCFQFGMSIMLFTLSFIHNIVGHFATTQDKVVHATWCRGAAIGRGGLHFAN